MTSTISQNSPFPPNAVYQQNSYPSQTSSYSQIPRNSPYQHQQYHSPVKQEYSSSSSSPSSVSSASASFPLGTLPPSFDHSHLIDGIPVSYILEKLHLLGPTYYNNRQTAYAELLINSLPNTTFYVHKEYLILQSIFFRQVFERVKNGDCITITLPAAPETFQPILEYLYTGDDDKWYSTMTIENWSNIYKNVQFLGLCTEAKAVCLAFYEHEIEPTLHRLFHTLPRRHKDNPIVPPSNRPKPSIKTCIILGSGGHTMEMFQLIEGLDLKTVYRPRIYVVTDNDYLSLQKVVEFENRKSGDHHNDHVVKMIPRSRQVGQSWLTTPFSVLKALIKCISLIFGELPDLIICNGPGSCIPVCVISYIPRILGIKWIKLIYVESFARVKTLSLSGKLLYIFVDRFLVQWPYFAEKYPNAEYKGLLV
ncbi:991_t:CDS:2 [Funneliformis mosseae]|uniref:UDP-N-acetylglucosamine transferase subunit ALG14 n=1 Tax=Funneliformis mosseae TaxID=27381 RepID=A0A9N9A165_FUNMO|nr:991_t:CDS:2 [Funneliformis mosseae]